MLQPPVETWLWRGRLILSAALFVALVYFTLFLWFAVPSLAHALTWQSDLRPIVMPTVGEPYRDFVQPGDIIVAVDGRQVRRGDLIFGWRTKPDYALTLLRDGFLREVTVSIPVLRSTDILQKGMSTLLACAFWLIGFLTIWYARAPHTSLLIVGLSLQLIGCGIVSPAPSHMGAPGAWLVGRCLIFLFPIILPYLATLPRDTPLGKTTARGLQLGLLICVLAGLAAGYESIALFPDASLETTVGVSPSIWLQLMTAVGAAAAAAIIAVRFWRTRARAHERRQLQILLVSVLLAVAPLLLTTLTPPSRDVLLPYPLLLSFLLFIPIGYFYVLHRRGLLVLDLLFGRLITGGLFALFLLIAYLSGRQLLQTMQPDWDVPVTGLYWLAVGMIIRSGRQAVSMLVDNLLYGEDQLDAKTLRRFGNDLANSPEAATVEHIVTDLVARLDCSHAAVIVFVGEKTAVLASTDSIPLFDWESSKGSGRVYLRAAEREARPDWPNWVELGIPIGAPTQELGVLLFARPYQEDFHQRHVVALRDIATMLASGIQLILLWEKFNRLVSEQRLDRELWHMRIASYLHDDPIQTLSSLIIRLSDNPSSAVVQESTAVIRQTVKNMRHVITELHPVALRESLEWMVRHVVRDFAEQRPDLTVEQQVQIEIARRPTEPVMHAVYHILREILRNIDKHAQATHVHVLLRLDRSGLLLRAVDDGQGLSYRPHHAVHSIMQSVRSNRFGVADMQRWALVTHGKLHIAANEPHGTQIEFTVPSPFGFDSPTVEPN